VKDFTDHAQCVVPADWIGDISQCWYEWQTLIGGFAAVVAAIFTIRTMKRQLAQVEKHRTDEIKRSHNAARIAMPFAVSKLSVWCQDLADILLDEKLRMSPEGILGMPDNDFIARSEKSAKLPPVPLDKSVSNSFVPFAATLDSDVDLKHITELVSRIQILESRWVAFETSDFMIEERLLSLLIDVSFTAYLNDCLFNYVRGLDEGSFGIVGKQSYEAAWRKIFGKTFSLVFNKPDVFDIRKINEMLERRIEDGSSPWLEMFEVAQ
jgi:hypothetical protein